MTNSMLDSLAKPPPPPSELDELMSRDPLELSAQDIDAIIAYQRQQRARREAGGRTRKPKAEAADSGIDLVALVKGTSTPVSLAPKAVPNVVGSIRRI
jgi:hypothetical protein